MEEIKAKLNTDELPALNLEEIAIGKTDKGNYIVPDEVMEKYYKILPNGTVNESNNKWAFNGGILNKANREVQQAGGKALQAKLEQRRSIQETVKIMLAQKASAEDIEQYNLPAGATQQDAMIAAMLRRAVEQKDVQASAFLRDTAGEKPSEKISAEVTQLTAEDREMLERVQKRLEEI